MIWSFHSWGYIQKKKQNQRKKKGRLHPNSVQDSLVFLREKQSRYPLIDARRKKKKWYLYAKEYYSTRKKSGSLSCSYVDGTEGYRAKRTKPDREMQTLHALACKQKGKLTPWKQRAIR